MDAEPKKGSSGSDTTLAQMVSTEGIVGSARVNCTQNGSNINYLSVPSYTGVGGTFTVSGWFKANAVSSYPRLISRKSVYNSNDGFECELSSSTTKIGARGASSAGVDLTPIPDITKNWIYLTLVYEGKTLTGYVNGARVNSGTIAEVNDNGLSLSFGNNAAGKEGSFNGRYDEIRLVKGAQSAERIAADYATMTDAKFLSSTGAASTDVDMPLLSAASVAWQEEATTVTVTLAAGVGSVTAVFKDAVTGTVYTIPLAETLDAREGTVTETYTISTEALPADATYSWTITVTNPKFDHPSTLVGETKYYSGDADPTVRYVSTTGSDDNDGLLLSTAKATLQAAIVALGEEGGTVYIDDGEYTFTSATDTAVTITTPVKVIGLSRDASKVTFTRTGTPKRNFRINHVGAGLAFVTVSGGSAEGDEGVSIALLQGVVSDCVIRDANCGSWNIHGALSAKGSSRVSRCVFYNNRGGWNNVAHGVALKATDNAVIENSLFYANKNDGGASNGGGTVHINGSARLVNCTIAGNTGNQCTGVYINSGNARVQNCAIFGNTASSDETGHRHIWSGNSTLFVNCASDAAINDDCPARAPGFRDAVAHDYTLSSASELIDQGMAYTDTVAISETDLAGNVRVVDMVDIGCYEYTKQGLDVGFTASESEGLMPLAVTFTANVTGTSEDVTYAWDFDNDGVTDETTTAPSVTHVYTTAGLTSIALTVTTAGGASKHAELLNAILISPKVVYADSANAANAAFPYDTLETATPDLATAIETAGNGSVVYVDGTYVATTVNGFKVDKNIRVESLSGKAEACVVKEADSTAERRVMTINHASVVVAGLTLEGGQLNTSGGATLSFGNLGGLVSNCVIRAGYVRDWGGDAALAQVTANGRVTHSIFEEGLARDDWDNKNSRTRTCSVFVEGLVDNCLIRNFNRQADNQNVVTVYNGGKLLNCTIVDGLCGSANDAEKSPCYGVRAEAGARIENCAIVGFRHVEEDESVTVRAWNGDPECFANCATDTAEAINETCITVTTEAFKDYANGDYRPTAALINKGKMNELAEGTDLVGAKRKNGTMDIGCYEIATGFTVNVR